MKTDSLYKNARKLFWSTVSKQNFNYAGGQYYNNITLKITDTKVLDIYIYIYTQSISYFLVILIRWKDKRGFWVEI